MSLSNITLVAEETELLQFLAKADVVLRSQRPVYQRLEALVRLVNEVNPRGLSPSVAEDFAHVAEAVKLAAASNLHGVKDQYLRLVNSTFETSKGNRLFFTIFRRTGEPNAEPCILLCRVNQRNLGLLNITRSRKFVETFAKRLGAKTYPEAILRSRMQGVDVMASAGVRPNVLFADFVLMPNDSGINPANAGGLLFDRFGDVTFKEKLPVILQAFPNVGQWLLKRNFLNATNIHFLTAAHVQAHDLCGHSVPFELRDETRCKVDWFLRAPLEELYADTNAMWVYSSPEMREILKPHLRSEEMDAIPLMIAMKRFVYYAMLPAEDLDARASWMMFNFLQKAGVITRLEGAAVGFHFNIEAFPKAIDGLLTETLRVEQSIAGGADSYRAACKAFNDKYGTEDSGSWIMPVELKHAVDSPEDVADAA